MNSGSPSGARSILGNVFFYLGLGMGVAVAFGVVSTFADAFQSSDWDERSAKGDFWGGHIGATMAVVSSLLFAITLLLQLHELRLQRYQLAVARDEAEQGRDIWRKQERHMQRQVSIADRSAVLSQVIELSRLRDEVQARRVQLIRDSRMVARHGVLRMERSAVFPEFEDRVTRMTSERVRAIDEMLDKLLAQDCVSVPEFVDLRSSLGLEIASGQWADWWE